MHRRWPTRSQLLHSRDEVFHCYNRGVDRQQLFFSNEFYDLFLSLVERFYDAAGLKILAYCLMPNHFHFLLRQMEALAVSRFMACVCSEYSTTVNHTRDRVGHLFQRRYGLKWVWRASDLPVLATYLHHNPVKAGLVHASEDWMFSSCREYFGLRHSGFLYMDDVLSNLNGFEDYRSFSLQHDDVERRLPCRSRFTE